MEKYKAMTRVQLSYLQRTWQNRKEEAGIVTSEGERGGSKWFGIIKITMRVTDYIYIFFFPLY